MATPLRPKYNAGLTLQQTIKVLSKITNSIQTKPRQPIQPEKTGDITPHVADEIKTTSSTPVKK